MIFHGVIGQDVKEKAWSFFNPDEVLIVVDYVKRLLKMTANKVFV